MFSLSRNCESVCAPKLKYVQLESLNFSCVQRNIGLFFLLIHRENSNCGFYLLVFGPTEIRTSFANSAQFLGLKQEQVMPEEVIGKRKVSDSIGIYCKLSDNLDHSIYYSSRDNLV